MKLLSICTGMGLMDRAFLDAGFDVVPGCEIDPEKRAMYRELCRGEPLVHDLKDLPDAVRGQAFDGVIGGPSCQSNSKLKAMRPPKFPDLTPLVDNLLEAIVWRWFVFENVVPIDLVAPHRSVLCNAMHYYEPHQSRERWFTFANVRPPVPCYDGDVDDLMAYPAVAGKTYGPKRASKLQGYPRAAELPVRCETLQHGLADAVPYPLAMAWAESVLRGCGEGMLLFNRMAPRQMITS